QSRRDHLGIVDDECIARTEETGEIAHRPILEIRCQAGPHHQEPRRVAWDGRPQSDPFGRQLEVEEISPHAPSYKGARSRSWSAPLRLDLADQAASRTR